MIYELMYRCIYYINTTVNISEVGGSEGCQGPPVNGKSFRFVRACGARCLDVKRNRSEIVMRNSFPFSLFPGEPFNFALFPTRFSLFPGRKGLSKGECSFFTTRVHKNDEEVLGPVICMSSRRGPLFVLAETVDIGAGRPFWTCFLPF